MGETGHLPASVVEFKNLWKVTQLAEMFLPICQRTQCYIPEGHNCDNHSMDLKSSNYFIYATCLQFCLHFHKHICIKIFSDTSVSASGSKNKFLSFNKHLYTCVSHSNSPLTTYSFSCVFCLHCCSKKK